VIILELFSEFGCPIVDADADTCSIRGCLIHPNNGVSKMKRLFDADDVSQELAVMQLSNPQATRDEAYRAVYNALRDTQTKLYAVSPVIYDAERLDLPSSLTTDEVELCGLLAEGYDTVELGGRYGISKQAVSKRIAKLSEKLGCLRDV
jgi:DNA-binding NarL/FixJ family response regulator